MGWNPSLPPPCAPTPISGPCLCCVLTGHPSPTKSSLCLSSLLSDPTQGEGYTPLRDLLASARLGGPVPGPCHIAESSVWAVRAGDSGIMSLRDLTRTRPSLVADSGLGCPEEAHAWSFSSGELSPAWGKGPERAPGFGPARAQVQWTWCPLAITWSEGWSPFLSPPTHPGWGPGRLAL